ncbi:MAG: preprotein translocase subunit SecY [Kiritimatiellae bacterium]|nr:preprotein translocase subunit SecY [Kiritimatiellia bacterium]
MLSAFPNSLKIPELRQRIFFTLGLVFICRLVAAIPIPGVDAIALKQLIEQIQNTAGGSFLGLYNLFSGGALQRFAVGSLGIMPYISASIILQLMTAVVPALERLAREGETGREKITEYTRYLTIILCVVQGFGMAVMLENPGQLDINQRVVLFPGWGFRIMAVLTMTTGSMLLMWFGEQITERGIGNGVSLVITVGIISLLPGAVQATVNMFTPVDGIAQFSIFHLVGLLVTLFLVIAGVVAVTQAQRKIPVQYAKRVVGRKVYGGQSTYMPLRVNYSGVMPIIFAQAILMFPTKLLSMVDIGFFKRVGAALAYGTDLYNLIYALMILFFSYFWVATQFNPIQIADDLKKHGGYVPGIRPGRPTAEYLDKTMTRITLAGAVFLTIIAVIPSVMAQRLGIPWIVASFFGGTSLLIIVGVMLDTMRQIESHLLTRHYDGFLKKGKLRSRR